MHFRHDQNGKTAFGYTKLHKKGSRNIYFLLKKVIAIFR